MTINCPINENQTSPAQHDAANLAVGFRFVRALAVEKAVLDPRLAPKEVRVLAAISYHMNATTMRAWPSYRKISEIVGYTDEVIERAIKNLIAYQYIFREPKRRAPYRGARAMVHYGLNTVCFDDIEQIIAAAVAQIRKSEDDKKGHARLIPLRKSGSDCHLTPSKKSGSTPDPDHLVASDPDHLVDRNPCEEPTIERLSDAAQPAVGSDLLSDFCVLYAAWAQEELLTASPEHKKNLEQLFADELSAATGVHGMDANLVNSAAKTAIVTIRAELAEKQMRSKKLSALFKYFRKLLDDELRRIRIGDAALRAAARGEQMIQEERLRQRMNGIARPRRKSRPSFEESCAEAFGENVS